MDSTNLLIFTTIFLYISLQFPSISKARPDEALKISNTPNELVTNVCKNTNNNYAFCMQIMKSKPQILSAKHIRTVADFALGVAVTQSISTHNFFSRVADSTQKNPVSRTAFQACATLFNETASMFKLDGLKNGETSLDVHYAADNAADCETAIAMSKVENALINARIRLWKNYYSVAYSAVQILEKQTPSRPSKP